jgi:poly-gamma-glutamate capsule biosynthesis protein CapA/YwtB (metallophosphatase superfamily)
VSNFPLPYRLTWLPRLLKPSLRGQDGSFEPASAAMPGEPPLDTVRIAFLGDISAVANREPPDIDPAIRETIASADLVVANCESPVVDRPRSPVGTRLGTRHAMTPVFLDAVLGAAGIVPGKLVLSLANNHALDQGPDGFEETVAALAGRRIRTAGTVADGPVMRTQVGPLTLGLLAFTEWRNAGAAAFAGRVTMLPDIAGWRRDAGVDLICAIPHWDREFRHFPRGATRALAKRLVEGGVGLIAGHHAHVLQPVERIGEALIAYGLGDFLGTALPRQPWPGRIGAVLLVDIGTDAGTTTGRIAEYRLQPFMRIRQGRHERLIDAAAVDGRIGAKVRARLAAIFGS